MRLTRTNSLLVLVAVVAICLSGVNAMAQRGGGGRPGGGGGGFGGGGSSLLDVAARKEVQEHLELLPDQINDLAKLREDEAAGRRDRFGGLDFRALRDGSDAERAAARAKIQETFRKAAAETKLKVDDILLPHQAKRLAQLATQRRLRGGISSVFGNEELSGQLGISPDQREELQEKARKADAEFRTKVAKLREEMQADLLKELLSPAQQAKYASLVGKPFEFAQDQRGQGGFGQGGRGGQPGGGGRPGGRTGRPGGGQDRGGRPRPQRPGN